MNEKCGDGSPQYVFLGDWQLMIGANKINFIKDCHTAQLCREVLYIRKRVMIRNCGVVELPVIATWTPIPSLLRHPVKC